MVTESGTISEQGDCTFGSGELVSRSLPGPYVYCGENEICSRTYTGGMQVSIMTLAGVRGILNPNLTRVDIGLILIISLVHQPLALHTHTPYTPLMKKEEMSLLVF